jgi:hypothetical protein
MTGLTTSPAAAPAAPPHGFDADEARAKRYADAFIRPGFFEAISALKGHVFEGGWTVRAVHAIGGVGILYRVERGDPVALGDGPYRRSHLLEEREERQCLLKIPKLPYDRPATFGSAQVRRLREEIAREARMLELFAGSLLPTLVELAEGANPLLAGRSTRLMGSERLVVMELIRAVPLDVAMRRGLDPAAAGAVISWISSILAFLRSLKRASPPRYYTDFKPLHVVVTPAQTMRLIDAGSIVAEGEPGEAPVSEGYCPRDLARAASTSSELERVSLTTLGRTFYAALTNRVLFEGVELDFDCLRTLCDRRVAAFVRAASAGRLASVEEALSVLHD